MKFSNKFKRILSAVLCLCMVMGALLAFASCNDNGDPQQTGDASSDSEKVTVVRAIEYVKVGSKIASGSFEEVSVAKNLVPEGAYSSVKDVVNKFLKTDVYAGDYLLADKVAPNMQALKGETSGDLHEDYVTVTDYLKGVSGDMSTAIQKAIDENPNRTIYFPDGTYLVHKPIKTSADPEKCVSIRLSTYAVISAGGTKDKWTDGMAVIELGAKDNGDAKYSFIGGVVNVSGMGKAGAISVCGGNALINNVSVKNAEIGITIKEGARADIDSCVVTCNSKSSAIGVLVESEENTLTNMRLCYMEIGIKLTGANNILRNVHPLYAGSDNSWSTGFYDVSEGNFYDACYSDQYAIAYYMGENTKSVYNGCYGYWYQGTGGNHYGFYAINAFNSIVRDTGIKLHGSHKEACDMTYLKVVKDDGSTSHEGNGVVLYPRNNGDGGGHANDEHSADWAGFLKTDRLA